MGRGVRLNCHSRRYESGCFDVLQWPTNMPRLFTRKARFYSHARRFVHRHQSFISTWQCLIYNHRPCFFSFLFSPPSTHTEQIINSPPCVSSGHTLGWPCLGSLNLPSSPYPQSRTSAHRNAGTAATLYVVSWTFRAPPGWG